MDVEHLPGRFINRDISKGEVVEAELDAFISRHDKMRRIKEGERAEEEAWRESTRRANAVREAELKAAWCEFHQEQAERHRATLEALAAHHEQRAHQLMSDQPKGAA